LSEAVKTSRAAAWLMAARPATLTVALVPVAVGTACAHLMGGMHLGAALAAVLGAAAIQIGTNFANDVFDYEKGADTEDRLGPTRAVQAGLISPRSMRRGMWLAFALAVVAGLYLVSLAGWPIVVVGLASIVSGIAYTGGPYPLGYNGLGDVFVLVFFGFVAVLGTIYVQAGVLSELGWWCSVPVGALATAILVVNNVRDHETDVLVGKRTVVVRFGRRFGLFEYATMILLSAAVPLALWWRELAGVWVLLPLVTMPWGGSLTRKIVIERGPALNPVLVQTAKLALVYGLLLALGLVLGADGI